jgi:hypothetical protein
MLYCWRKFVAPLQDSLGSPPLSPEPCIDKLPFFYALKNDTALGRREKGLCAPVSIIRTHNRGLAFRIPPSGRDEKPDILLCGNMKPNGAFNGWVVNRIRLSRWQQKCRTAGGSTCGLRRRDRVIVRHTELICRQPSAKLPVGIFAPSIGSRRDPAGKGE